jgi:multidrug efflux pump subunit AcrA (membrane-fusion protein)
LTLGATLRLHPWDETAYSGEEGKFVQRQVRLGPPMGDSYTVLSGLRAGDMVVTEGSFFLRAEALRNTPSG